MGFLSEGSLVSKEVVKSSRCGACGLFKKCNSPKMKTAGKGKKGILFVLPPVSESEDESSTFLNHTYGKWLRQILQQQGIDPLRDCWFTSSLICHTPKFDNTHVDNCRYMLSKEIDRLQPKVIVPIGDEAIRSVITLASNTNAGTINRWIGWRIPSQVYNAWICPTHSWAGEKEDSLILRRLKAHILGSLALEKHPWQTVPNWTEQVHQLSEKKAVKFINRLTKSNEPFAFDYETSALKPEGPASDIVSAAITIQGKVTAAFAWNRAVATAVRPLMMNKAYKIAANCKFEDRWTRVKLKTPVKNWAWDTMQAAHCLDNREQITSVSFCAFVYLGFPEYDSHIKPYLYSSSSYEPNNINQITLKDLLQYNGLDTLLEWEIAIKQMEMMDHPILQKIKP